MPIAEATGFIPLLWLKLEQTFCDGVAHVTARRRAAYVVGAHLPGI